MVAPKVTALADALADVPAGTRIMRSSLPCPDVVAAWAPALAGGGFASIWLIFEAPEARQAYLLRYLRTWIATADRCCLLDYWVTWDESGGGYGLEMTTFRVADIGADRYATRPAPVGGVR